MEILIRCLLVNLIQDLKQDIKEIQLFSPTSSPYYLQHLNMWQELPMKKIN